VEVENLTAARQRVKATGKAGLDAGTLVEERQGADVRRNHFRQADAVTLRLDFDAGKGLALALGLDDADRLAVHKEQVIRRPVPLLEGELTRRHAAPGVQIEGAGVLDNPTGGGQGFINRNAGLLFGR
jgi:hypothetical protein